MLDNENFMKTERDMRLGEESMYTFSNKSDNILTFWKMLCNENCIDRKLSNFAIFNFKYVVYGKIFISGKFKLNFRLFT